MNALEALRKAYATPSMENVAAPPLSGVQAALDQVPSPDRRTQASVQPSIATMFSQVSRATHVVAVTFEASSFVPVTPRIKKKPVAHARLRLSPVPLIRRRTTRLTRRRPLQWRTTC